MRAKFSSQYLFNTFRPMALTPLGVQRAKAANRPLFIDGSCRREPDLESKFPSITALCRTTSFAPRLNVGHNIAYCARKNAYTGKRPFWCLVALLKVIHRFETHQEAARWYTAQGLPLPSNCMVEGNEPEPFDTTLGFPDKKTGTFVQNERYLKAWDNSYWERAQKNGHFLVCETLQTKHLDDPVIITPEIVRKDYPSGKLPNSFKFRFEISGEDWNWLLSLSKNGTRLSEI